jgi:hypothetical protein
MKPTRRGIVSLREDFARWREDPMTRTVLGALQLAEKAQKEAWDEASWSGGIVRGDDLERELLVLRTRADAYASLHEMTFEDICTWLEIDPDA